jgi:hypothetical protein
MVNFIEKTKNILKNSFKLFCSKTVPGTVSNSFELFQTVPRTVWNSLKLFQIVLGTEQEQNSLNCSVPGTEKTLGFGNARNRFLA